MKINIKKIYNSHVRPRLVACYHQSTYFAKLVDFIRRIQCYFHSDKDNQALKNLESLINHAKLNKQKIFVQFPTIPWDLELFQRPQQLAKAMAETGYLVIYILPPLVVSDAFKKIAENLYITNQDQFLKKLKGALISIYLSYPAYLNNYYDRYLSKNFLKNNVVFCEYIDHIDEKIWGNNFAKILQERFEALGNTGYKFLVATAKILHQELVNTYPHQKVIYLPNGVDLTHYQNGVNNTGISLPPKLQKAIKDKKKIIGYFGAIAPWLWQELIVELAKARPDYFILLIGPLYGDHPTFQERDNLLLTGFIDYKELPVYAKYFDASIIPFQLGDIARSTSPLKLFEYFAIGKPIIVTSDLIECTKFDGVFSASSIDEFISKTDEAIETANNPSLQVKYKKHAENNSWIKRSTELDKQYKSIKL